MAIDVSVVIPTFRRPVQLEEAIRSALGQEGVNVEIHVVDDSPEGSAAAVIEKIGDPRVRYQKMDVPTGGIPGRVRNAALPSASGEFIHFLDDDDVMAPGAYSAMVGALRKRPRAGVVFGLIAPFGDDPAAVAYQRAYFRNAARRARLSWALRSKRLMVTNMIYKPTVLVCSSALVRRTCVEALGGFDEKVRLVEDVDFYIRAIWEFGFVFLERVLLNYRIAASSLMHSQKDASIVTVSYGHMFAQYRARHGAAQLLALKLVARAGLWWT